MNNSTLIVHSPEYANWKFSDSHPTQGRRFINAYNAFTMLMGPGTFNQELPRIATSQELRRVHSEEYVHAVLNNYVCSEWQGARADLAHLAQKFAGGTLTALISLIKGECKSAIHFPGAKHHAQIDHASGFCIFADFALAADVATKDYGKKIAILDFDAHHGDGTENLTSANPDVLSFSIHEWGIFPGTGQGDDPVQKVYNAALTSVTGKGDQALLREIGRFNSLAEEFAADLIFIAAGADGHAEDPLSTLEFTVDGYIQAAHLIREAFSTMPILIGGAGGYLPDTRTPEVWSHFAHKISTK